VDYTRKVLLAWIILVALVAIWCSATRGFLVF
jgi:hypothetical protein